MSSWPLAYLQNVLNLPKCPSGICFASHDPRSAHPQLGWSLLLYGDLQHSWGSEFIPYLDDKEDPTVYPKSGYQG